MTKTLTPDFTATCTCGKHVYIFTSDFAVAHELPMCREFKERDVVDFLRYLRVRLTGITDN